MGAVCSGGRAYHHSKSHAPGARVVGPQHEARRTPRPKLPGVVGTSALRNAAVQVRLTILVHVAVEVYTLDAARLHGAFEGARGSRTANLALTVSTGSAERFA